MNDHANLPSGSESTDASDNSDVASGVWDEAGLLVATSPPKEVPPGYSTSPESLKSTKDKYKP